MKPWKRTGIALTRLAVQGCFDVVGPAVCVVHGVPQLADRYLLREPALGDDRKRDLGQHVGQGDVALVDPEPPARTRVPRTGAGADARADRRAEAVRSVRRITGETRAAGGPPRRSIAGRAAHLAVTTLPGRAIAVVLTIRVAAPLQTRLKERALDVELAAPWRLALLDAAAIDASLSVGAIILEQTVGVAGVHLIAIREIAAARRVALGVFRHLQGRVAAHIRLARKPWVAPAITAGTSSTAELAVDAQFCLDVAALAAVAAPVVATGTALLAGRVEAGHPILAVQTRITAAPCAAAERLAGLALGALAEAAHAAVVVPVTLHSPPADAPALPGFAGRRLTQPAGAHQLRAVRPAAAALTGLAGTALCPGPRARVGDRAIGARIPDLGDVVVSPAADGTPAEQRACEPGESQAPHRTRLPVVAALHPRLHHSPVKSV